MAPKLSWWVLAAGLAVLTVLAAVVPDAGDPAAIDDRPSAVGPRAVAPTAVPGERISAEVAIALTRPLFAPDRRPAATDGLAGPVSTDTGIPRLTGIIIDRSGRRAIFAPASAEPAGRARLVGLRDQIGTYSVQTIEPNFVVLDGPGGTLRLQPRPATGGPPMIAVTTPVPVAQPTLAVQQDPARFLQPIGPLGVSIYSFSPAAPKPAPAPVLGFETAR